MDREDEIYSSAFQQTKELYEKDGLKFNPAKSTVRSLMFTGDSPTGRPWALIDLLYLSLVQKKAIWDCINKYGRHES